MFLKEQRKSLQAVDNVLDNMKIYVLDNVIAQE